MTQHRHDFPESLIEQAIAWSVALRSGTAGPELTQACDAWRTAAVEHELAWQSIQQVEAPFASVAAAGATTPVIADVARRTLECAHAPPNLSRRRAVHHLTVAVVLGGLGYAGYTHWAPQGSYTTAVAERRTILLADGTRLVLNAMSAVEVRYDKQSRTVLLRKGEIFVETGHRSTDGQPLPAFWLVTQQGRMEALGTRFMVRLEERSTVVQVDEGAVGVYVRGADYPVLVRPGQAQRLDDSGMIAPVLAQPDAAAWTDGTVVAHAIRLGDLLASLSRYRHGWLSCEPSVADLRISGVFSLDDTDLALSTIARSLPVRIVRRTSYWVRVVPA